MVRGLSMRSFANCTRLALIVLSCSTVATGGFAHADTPAPGAIPPGWVWQGVWQDGRWSGRWTPGPGVAPAAPGTGSYAPPQGFGPSMPQQGPAPVAPAYPAMAFGTPETPPVGYMMVPVPTSRQQPCVETRTVITSHITSHPTPHLLLLSPPPQASGGHRAASTSRTQRWTSATCRPSPSPTR